MSFINDKANSLVRMCIGIEFRSTDLQTRLSCRNRSLELQVNNIFLQLVYIGLGKFIADCFGL